MERAMTAMRVLQACGVLLALCGLYFLLFSGDTAMRIVGFVQVLCGVGITVGGRLEQRRRAG